MDGDFLANIAPAIQPPPVPLQLPPPVPLPVEGSPDEYSSSLPGDPIPDTRLYLPDHEDWEVHIKRDSERDFCYSKHPGEDWFHLILSGEIYVSRQHEKYCLRCALRMGHLTEDRLFWQHRVPKKRPRVV